MARPTFRPVVATQPMLFTDETFADEVADQAQDARETCKSFDKIVTRVKVSAGRAQTAWYQS